MSPDFQFELPCMSHRSENGGGTVTSNPDELCHDISLDTVLKALGPQVCWKIHPDLAYYIKEVISECDTVSWNIMLQWTDSIDVLLDSLVERRSIGPVLVGLSKEDL